jgi:hypothetical protein
MYSNYLTAKNIQGGRVTITTDGSGDGTRAVTFKKTFKGTPVVLLTQQEADITGTVNATSVTKSGFTAKIDGSAKESSTVSVGWIAFDQLTQL